MTGRFDFSKIILITTFIKDKALSIMPPRNRQIKPPTGFNLAINTFNFLLSSRSQLLGSLTSVTRNSYTIAAFGGILGAKPASP